MTLRAGWRSGAALGAISAALAVAVAAPARAGSGAESVIEELVVTAQRRAQDVQDVPAALTALSSETLRTASIRRSEDIARLVPNVQIANTTSGGNPNYTIRGVSSLGAQFTVQSSPAAINMDGVYMTTGAFTSFPIFDLERIEVLRGPQGTLYGRNSTAGAINFISAAPSRTATGYVDATVASFGRRRLEGAAGGPLGEAVSVRVSGLWDKSAGYVFNRLTGKDTGGADVAALRATLDYKVSESTDLRVSAHGLRDRSESQQADDLGSRGAACVLTIPRGYKLDAKTCVDAFGYSDTDGDPFAGAYSVDGRKDAKAFGTYAQVTHETPIGELVFLTSYDRMRRDFVEDQDSGPQQITDITYHEKYWQTGQEVRLTSLPGSKWTWTIGANYGRAKFDITRFIPTFLNASNVTYRNIYNEKAWAVFAHTEIPLTDRLTAIAGARYSYEKKKSAIENEQRRGGVITAALCDFSTCTGEGTWREPTATAGLRYTVSDDVLVYGTVSRGFKSGGYPGGITVNPGIFRKYDPEFVTSYEAGIKSEWLDRTLRVNLATFYYDYSDRQVFTILPLAPGSTTVVQIFTNAATARLYGAEGEAIWQATPELRFGLNVGLFNGKYTDYVLPPQLNAAAADLTGKEYEVPKANANLNATYVRELSNGTSLTARVEASYQAPRWWNANNLNYHSEKEYVIWNGRVEWDSGKGWKVGGFVNNVTDTLYRQLAIVGPVGNYRSFYGQPRELGLNVHYAW